ncbi:hypothetical protein EJB05_47607, partial [Eragrostis curvula]
MRSLLFPMPAAAGPQRTSSPWSSLPALLLSLPSPHHAVPSRIRRVRSHRPPLVFVQHQRRGALIGAPISGKGHADPGFAVRDFGVSGVCGYKTKLEDSPLDCLKTNPFSRSREGRFTVSLELALLWHVFIGMIRVLTFGLCTK